MSSEEAAATTTPAAEAPGGLTADVLTKYKTAADIAQKALKAVIAAVKVGGSILDAATLGDKLIEEETGKVYNKGGATKVSKGISFPTSIAINNIVNNFSPLPTSEGPSTFSAGDVIKIMLGAHIDGYASISAETIVLNSDPWSASNPLTGVKADLLLAAYQASEAVLRTVKPGLKNWELTDVVGKVLKEYGEEEGKGSALKAVEGQVSYQHEKDTLDGKKRIWFAPTTEQRVDKECQFTLEEGEVFGLDIIVTNSTDKAKTDASRTTIYSKTTSTYSLKMKTSRSTFSEISKKAGPFPFTLRSLEDEKKARMGVQECVQHGLLRPFEVSTTAKPNELAAQIFLTFAVGKNGAIRITHPPLWEGYTSREILKPEREVKDEGLKELLTRSLKPGKKKAAKKD
ncbi:Creatinase/aminopeptidase [Atractiella rhizophila]|nr:Creatinase/aminopeptidase [Atractiella rhizophila]